MAKQVNPGFSKALESHAGWAKRRQHRRANNETVKGDLRGWSSCAGRGGLAQEGGASQVRGLPGLALGQSQAHQEKSVALLEELIRENQYPFVEAFLQDLPNMLRGWKQLRAGLSSIFQEGDWASWLLKKRVTPKATNLGDIRSVLLF